MKQKAKPEELIQAVYEIVLQIPPGRATSYGLIAKAIGYPDHSRMIGKIMSGSKLQYIPAHRVVNSQGILSAKSAFGLGKEMQELLESEGVMVENNRIKNWRKVCWNPLEEL